MKKIIIIITMMIIMIQTADALTLENPGDGNLLSGLQYVRKGHDMTNGSTSQVGGQTFNVSCTTTYSITRINFTLKSLSTGTVNIRLSIMNATSTAPYDNQAVIEYDEYDTAAPGATPTNYDFNFTTNELNCNEHYAFILSSASATTNWGYYGGNNYADGIAIVKVEDPSNTWNTAADDWGFIITYTETIPTTPEIDNTTINFTSGENTDDQIAWRTNNIQLANTTDTTPTIYLETDLATSARISIYNLNYTDMLSNGSYYECAESESTTHTCTWGTSLTEGEHELYISINKTSSATADGGLYNLSVRIPEYLTTKYKFYNGYIEAPSLKLNNNSYDWNCTTTEEAMLRYDYTLHTIKYCNSTEWITI